MLSFKSVTKSFPGVKALRDVSFSVCQGNVHALCGENGAGKSTLLKVLSGVYLPDSGSVTLDDRVCRYGDTAGALAAGIAVIYQELNLIPELSVAENIWLGHLPSRLGFVDRTELQARTQTFLSRVGLTFPPSTKVKELSLAQRQMVEIAKALTHDAKVIAFDEPTSSLSAREVERLFELISELKAAGKAILYVSHRMDEVKQICDACTVLRDGQHVETFTSLDHVTPGTIINRMVGREISDVFSYQPRTLGDAALSVENVGGLSLTVGQGEIVGVFGLVGAGRTELLKAIYDGNSGTVNGLARRSPRASIENGIVFISEDRKHEGIIPLMSVAENLNLSVRRKSGSLRNLAKERANAAEYVERLKVKTASLETLIGTLSGGNQQKVILGRWLSENAKVILLDEPTRGIDVGAKSEIYALINGLASQGVGVLLVSSELPEVMGVSDRIIVMREGAISGEVLRQEATEALLLSLALPEGNANAA